MTGRAPIIIELQVGSFIPLTASHDAGGLVAGIDRLAGRVRQNAGTVSLCRMTARSAIPVT